MPNFTGTLNANAIQALIFNMIISQDILSGDIKHNYNLVDKARVDGSLYGDTKLYYDCPTLKTAKWTPDSSDAINLLELHRPEPPKVQSIVFGEYRQVALTQDDYLSKQAFSSEGTFSTYHARMMGRLEDAKAVYENTTYNCRFGTSEQTSATKHLVEVPLSDITATGEEKNKLEAEMIANYIADLISDMEDYSTDYSGNGFLRSYSSSEIKIVWNTKFLNKIRKVSLPVIFHKDGLIDKFGEEKLAPKYFGEVNAGATVGAANGSVRSLIEQDIGSNHYIPGQSIKTTDTAPAGTSYTQDDDVICKVYVGNPLPFMSAFSVGTSFFNGRNLSTTNFLTFGHNKLELLKAYPFITVHAD